uniref:MICOS complex subunit MIC19 n=1 Tax=Leptobrachium leishanense TaxID=445787 RepID=A0A8C5MWZ9_9ANUR
MGDSSSKTRVSFEADENDNITVVKRIRLSDNVINRMREPSSPAPKPRTPPQSQYTPQPSPPLAKPLANLQRTPAALEAVDDDGEMRVKRVLGIEAESQKRFEQGRFIVQDEIGKALERERAAAATEEERLKAKSFAKKLEEKERELKRQDEFHMDQLARLEERSSPNLCSTLASHYLQCVRNAKQTLLGRGG